MARTHRLKRKLIGGEQAPSSLAERLVSPGARSSKRDRNSSGCCASIP
jgi:hypothetical protein